MIPEEIFDRLEWHEIESEELEDQLEGFLIVGAEPVFDCLDKNRKLEGVLLTLKRPDSQELKVIDLSSEEVPLYVSEAYVPPLYSFLVEE